MSVLISAMYTATYILQKLVNLMANDQLYNLTKNYTIIKTVLLTIS